MSAFNCSFRRGETSTNVLIFSLFRRRYFFSFYWGQSLRDGSDDIRRVIAMAIPELAVLTGVLFLLFAADVAEPYYFVGLLRFYHVGGGVFGCRPLYEICLEISGSAMLLKGCAWMLFFFWRFIA